MQTFSTQEIRHEFQIDDTVYYLPGVTMADFAAAARLAFIEDPREQIESYGRLLSSKAKSETSSWRLFFSGRKTPRRAIMSLNMQQLGELFSEWSKLGETVGEPSGSQVSASNTNAN